MKNKLHALGICKRIVASLLFLFAFNTAFSQNPAFQVTSTTGGFVAPILTTLQRTTNFVGTPAEGSLVYDTDINAYFYYSGTGWVQLTSSTGTVTSVAALTLGTTGTDLSSTVATGTTTPVITLNVPTASATIRGALSSTDWSTFNGKESALTFSTPLSRATNTISIPVATTSVNGYLSSTDWTTFNNKQSSLTFSTGLTNTSGTVTVNTSQNISTLSNLTTNGLIKTSGGTGALSIATAGTDYVSAVANPTGTIGLTAVNGTATTAMRSDGAPALSQAIIPSWTGLHTFTLGITSTGTSTISLGADAAVNTLSLGTGAAAKTVSLGSTNTTSATTINSGTGGLAMNTGAATNATTTLGTSGSQVFGSSTATSDKIAIKPQSTTTTGAFTGTITSADLTAARTWTFPDGDLTIPSGSGTANQATYWSGANALTSNAAVTINPNTTTTTLGSLAVTSSSITASTQAIYGSATGNALVNGVYGTTTSTTTNASGVKGEANGAAASVNGVYGASSSTAGTGVYGYATAASGSTYGVIGASTSTGGTGMYGIASGIAAASTWVYGAYAQATGTSSNASSGNIGVSGLASGNSILSIGVNGQSTQGGMIGVRGLFSGTSTTTGGTGVYGVNTSTGGSSTTATLFGVYGSASGTQGGTGQTRIGVFGAASGSSYNVAGYFGGGGEVVLPYLAAGTSRLWNGSLFVANNFSRLYWTGNSGTAVYVNSSGTGDYSEFFRNSDNTMSVGEVVALNPDLANGVRRARPSDAAVLVGVVSQYGTQNNDDPTGERLNNKDYVNVGMLGQVPVLITTENGPIKPGDPLTSSPTLRGRATKAIGPCRIIGFATTHFPYVSGEKTSLDDSRGDEAVQLKGDHVMCYINIGWYEPTQLMGDGIEPPKQDETVWETTKRIQDKKEKDYLSSEQYQREKRIKEEMQEKLKIQNIEEPLKADVSDKIQNDKSKEENKK